MTETDVAKQNVELARRYLDSVSCWDFATMREILHPDIVIELPWTIEPFPKVTKGLANVMAYTESAPTFAIAENLYDYEIHVFADDVNELYMEFKSDMTLKSGREYKNDYLARMTIKGGKIVRFCEWPDPIRLLQSLGGSVNPPTDLPEIVTP